jgi:hypothetical protein
MQLLFGNSATDSRIAFGATSITAPSDMRLKEDIQDDTAGLSFINDLRPVTYKWRQEKDIPSEMRTHVGALIPMLVNAIKELKARIETLENK